MAYPPVIIVDTDDHVIGEVPLAEARTKGLIYRVVFVVAQNDEGRYLLQRRSEDMPLFPGRWDTTASGHVDDGHSYEEAALLELQEEVGIEDAHLEEAAHFYTDMKLMGMASKRYAKFYRIHLQGTPTGFGVHEVSSVRWFTKDEIAQLLRDQPELVSEGLQHLWDRVLS